MGGIQYLRDYLHLPPEIVPATLRKATSPPKVDSNGINETSEVDPHEIATVVIVTLIVVRVVVVMLVWIREVLGTTSNQNSVVEWVVLEEGVVGRLQAVVLVHHHLLALVGLVLHHQVKMIDTFNMWL